MMVEMFSSSALGTAQRRLMVVQMFIVIDPRAIASVVLPICKYDCGG